MSDKYLTVREWQKFSAERAYKDSPAGKALVKALGESEKAADAPPAEQLRILEDLEAAGRDLLKLYKGDKKLQSYLEDVYKPLKKHRKSAEKTQAKEEKSAAKAASADGADDEDDEKGHALLDPKRLLAQLTLCRKNPGRVVQYGYVDGKDKGPAALALSPKVAGRKLYALLCDQLGGKIGSFGSVRVEGTELMVQPDKPQGGLAKKLRQPVKDCGFRVSKIILVTADGSVLEQDDALDDDTPGEVAGAADTPGVAPEEPAPTGPTGAEFNARLKSLLPRIAAAGATKEGQAARLLATEAGGHAKRGDYAAAEAGLDKVDKLLARLEAAAAASEPAAPVAEAPAAPDNELLALRKRMAALAQRIQQAATAATLKSTLQRAVAAFQDRIKEGKAEEARAALADVEAVLAGGAGADARLLERWQAARQGWQAAVESVDDQINALARALRESGNEDLREIADSGLSSVTGGYRTRMTAAMIDIGVGDVAKLRKNGARAAGFTEKLIDQIDGDARVIACDTISFGVPVSIRATLGPALKGLAGVLREAARAG